MLAIFYCFEDHQNSGHVKYLVVLGMNMSLTNKERSMKKNLKSSSSGGYFSNNLLHVSLWKGLNKSSPFEIASYFFSRRVKTNINHFYINNDAFNCTEKGLICSSNNYYRVLKYCLNENTKYFCKIPVHIVYFSWKNKLMFY